MTFGEVASMDRWELAHWIAMTRMAPPVTDAMNMMFARLCSVVANHAFCSKGGAKPSDFYIDFEKLAKPRDRKQEALAGRARWIAWASAANKR